MTSRSRVRARFAFLVLVGRCALAGSLMSACRQDMHDGPRYDPLAAERFLPDKRASRPLVEGTVARGHLRDNDAL